MEWHRPGIVKGKAAAISGSLTFYSLTGEKHQSQAQSGCRLTHLVLLDGFVADSS